MDSPTRKNSTTEAIEAIRSFLGERLSTAKPVREQHGKDQTWNEGFPPDAVAFVKSTEEVQRIVQICAKTQTPVIAYGRGGATETIVPVGRPGATGVWFEEQTTDALVAAMERFEREEFDPNAARTQALTFDRRHFESQLLNFLNRVLERTEPAFARA